MVRVRASRRVRRIRAVNTATLDAPASPSARAAPVAIAVVVKEDLLERRLPAGEPLDRLLGERTQQRAYRARHLEAQRGRARGDDAHPRERRQLGGLARERRLDGAGAEMP